MTAPASAFDLLDAAAIEALPDLDWLIAGVIPAPSFAVLYGSPGAGKSFCALSLSLAVASGSPWLGRETRRAPVLYIAAEGVLGLKLRLRAHREKYGVPPPSTADMRFVASAIEIMNPEHVAALLAQFNAAGFRPGLIVVDTLARVALGADENSASAMGLVVDGFDALRRETGAAVLVLHHDKKGGGAERGSSALRGAADVMIKCEALGDGKAVGVTLECDKMKDAEPFGLITAGLESVKLPDGSSSLVVTLPGDFLAQFRAAHAEKILDLLRTQFAETGATHGELKKAFVAAKLGSESTFNRAIRELKDSKQVEYNSKLKRYFLPQRMKADL
ncbi:MAG: AAA family ATPase [Rubrimonas sp.]